MDKMKEIVEKLDEKNEFFNNYKEYKKEVKEAEVNQDEQKELEAYQKKLDAEGYDELLKLEKETGVILPNSPTQRVGGEVLEKFEKHTHLRELYSLQKAQSFEELEDFHNRCLKLLNEYNSINNTKKTLEYYVEYKFDGLTINLTYDKGILISASTRGNGVYGEEVFEQVKTIKSIPLEIDYKGLVEIQGEAIMPLSALAKYNETAEVPLKNARNAAAGARLVVGRVCMPVASARCAKVARREVGRRGYRRCTVTVRWSTALTTRTLQPVGSSSPSALSAINSWSEPATLTMTLPSCPLPGGMRR